MDRRGFIQSLLAGMAATFGASRIHAETETVPVRMPKSSAVSVFVDDDTDEDDTVESSGLTVRVAAGETLRMGDLVRVGPDGRVYNMKDLNDGLSIGCVTGFAEKSMAVDVRLITPRF